MLAYLHSHDHLRIQRYLKCENDFVNEYLGPMKIGNLGLNRE